MPRLATRPTCTINGKVVPCVEVALDPGFRDEDALFGFEQKFLQKKKRPSASLVVREDDVPDLLLATRLDVVITYSERKRWVFPTDNPFIIYEPSDEEWCRYAGIGHEETYTVEYHLPCATARIERSNTRFPEIVISGNATIEEREIGTTLACSLAVSLPAFPTYQHGIP